MRRLVAGAGLLLAAACGGTDVRSGAVPLTLTGPVPARGVVFQLAGKHDTITVPSGQPYRVFTTPGTGDTVTVVVVANQGSTLTGAIVDVHVPDVRVPPTFTMIQVAAANYSLQTASAYTVGVQPSP